MALTPLILVIFFNFILTFYLLNRYGNLAKHNVWITTSVFVSWFFSFNVIFILPLDVTSTIYNQCIYAHNKTIPIQNVTDLINSTIISNQTNVVDCETSWSYIPSNVLLTLWQFIYWSSQVLTWLLLPIFQSYSMSGEFTPFRKIKSSFIENVKYYCFFGLLSIIFLIYYVSKEHFTFEGLKVFCISASNTFGLFLLTILMGYGLVEIPRNCFLNYSSDDEYKLKYLYFKIAKTSDEKCKAVDHLEDLLDEIRDLNAYANSTNNHRFIGYLGTILRQCPETFQNGRIAVTASQETEAKLTEKNIIKLNAKFKRAVQTHHRTKVQEALLVQEAIMILRPNTESNSGLNRFEIWLQDKIPPSKWLFSRKDIIYRIISLLIGYFLAAFSVMIIWSEFTFFIQSIPISIFALIVKLLGYNYLWIEIFSMISIAYLCTCCYYTIFKIRIFNYYYLAKHHQTDEYSLIFCGMLMCRLASPLCLNFLSLIHLDSHITTQSDFQETSFTKIMGHMDTISFISDHLFLYLPVLMSLFCVTTFFKLGSKIVHYFGIEQFSTSDEMDFIKDGENIVKRECQKLNRAQGPQVLPVSAQHSFKRQPSSEQLLNSPDEKAYVVNKNIFNDI